VIIGTALSRTYDARGESRELMEEPERTLKGSVGLLFGAAAAPGLREVTAVGVLIVMACGRKSQLHL